MDAVSPILDVASRLWTCTTGHVYYITGLEENLASVMTKMEELKAISNDVKSKVIVAEQQGKKQTEQVQVWLTRVEETENKVTEILRQNELLTSNNTSTCLKICHCRSAYKIGKKARKTLNIIIDLISRGENFPEVATQQPFPEGLCEMPMRNPVGTESVLEKAMKGLKDEKVGIIGLYGMGGVGKTTLLKKINNELAKSDDGAFDKAFWIVASRNATIETIQRDILGKLDIPFKSESENSFKINEILREKKYILMLDDVWVWLDLYEKVGIPEPDNRNRSKIIFTTRSKAVCSQMGAHLIIKVKCLPWEKAWSLFQEKVGKTTLSPEIECYAIPVAEECKGLPLALITVGRAMSGKETPYDWSHALHQLQNCPAEFTELEEDVFPALQLSYDYVADSTKKQCFLYCSLFPEDYIILNSNLVDLWMGEGYLNKKHDIREARDYGYSIIADLKRACLLESGNLPESVKMHDVIRDMALSIANKKFLILEKAKLMRVRSNIQDWNEDVEKMSLWGSRLVKDNIEEGNSSQRNQKKLTLTRECPKLSTLLLKDSPRVSILALFNFIPNVRVLDLSESFEIERLPKVISELKNLEYLDISMTRIMSLPREMKNLRKLRYLLMSSLARSIKCPTELISGFTELLVFHMEYHVPLSKELLAELEKLQNIQEIRFNLNSSKMLEYFLRSEKLQLCTTYMQLYDIIFEELELCPSNMRNLESLNINYSTLSALKCSNPTTLMVFNYLRCVHIWKCNSLYELDFLAYAPSIINLRVSSCNSIRRILHIKEAERVFLSLKELFLEELPCLKIICNNPLTFPTLEEITIGDCSKLQQNPFNDMIPFNSNLRSIRAEKEWWDSLEWRDDFKQHFSQYFKEYTTQYDALAEAFRHIQVNHEYVARLKSDFANA